MEGGTAQNTVLRQKHQSWRAIGCGERTRAGVSGTPRLLPEIKGLCWGGGQTGGDQGSLEVSSSDQQGPGGPQILFLTSSLGDQGLH